MKRFIVDFEGFEVSYFKSFTFHETGSFKPTTVLQIKVPADVVFKQMSRNQYYSMDWSGGDVEYEDAMNIITSTINIELDEVMVNTWSKAAVLYGLGFRNIRVVLTYKHSSDYSSAEEEEDVRPSCGLL